MDFQSFDDHSDIFPLCYYGHPALRVKCRTIPQITDEIKNLSEKMIRTMFSNNGIGLAAPQVGRKINLVVLNIPMEERERKRNLFTSPGEINLLPRMPLGLVNPKLSHFGEDKKPYVEGCLSIPDVNAEVFRPEFVHLDAELLTGEKISYHCGGLLSRCLQHEIDHLNGILFIDLLSAEVLKPIKKHLRQIKKTSGLN